MIGSRLVMAVAGRPFCTASLTCFHKSSRCPACDGNCVAMTRAKARNFSVRFIIQLRGRQDNPANPSGKLDGNPRILLPGKSTAFSPTVDGIFLFLTVARQKAAR